MPAELKIAPEATDEEREQSLTFLLDQARVYTAQSLADESSRYVQVKQIHEALQAAGASEDVVTQIEAVRGAFYQLYYGLGLLVGELSPRKAP